MYFLNVLGEVLLKYRGDRKAIANLIILYISVLKNQQIEKSRSQYVFNLTSIIRRGENLLLKRAIFI